MPSGRVAGKAGVYSNIGNGHSSGGFNEEIIWISIAMSILIGILILIALCYLFREKCKKRREILFMAVVSVNLASMQDCQNTDQLPVSDTTMIDEAKPVLSEFENQTVFTPLITNITSTSKFAILPAGKNVLTSVIKRKYQSKNVDIVPAHSHNYEVTIPKKLQTKSDLQIVPYYAQPLDTIDLNVQPVSPYEYNSPSGPMAFSSINQNSLFVNSISTIPTQPLPQAPLYLPYQTLPQNEFVGREITAKPLDFRPLKYSWNAPSNEMHYFKPVPILDPFNLYKRPRPAEYQRTPPRTQKIIATAKPATSPVSVAHVFKYTNDGGLKIPFLMQDDSLDDSIPILSAALDKHLHKQDTNIGEENYLTPPRISQPFRYTMPEITRSPLNNEHRLLDKYNAALRTQIHHSAEKYDGSDEVGESQEEKNYTDEDVKKTLEYIRGLKMDKGQLSGGSNKYRNSGDKLAEMKSSRKMKKKQRENEDYKETVKEGNSKRARKKRRKRPRKERIFEGNEDFQVDSFGYDKNQEESQKNIVKAEQNDHKDHVRSQESQIMPSVNDENAVFNFESNVNIRNGEGDERIQFQMHGLQGPESYKFGYDTGKGENRQFRYEERDPEGRVKGHFGYYDRDGKLRVFNYEADPENGYHLEKVSE